MRAWLMILFTFTMAASFAQTASPIRFMRIDLSINTGDQPLAAYQLDFRATRGKVKIVGVEGGESPVFKEAPYYDPKAIQQERVIIAAFSTESPDKLPKGKTRVAAIHVQISGNLDPEYRLQLKVVADHKGKKITGEATFRTPL